ncbi:FAS1-like dehydratase domain-containing protein [Microbacterium aurum]
MTSPLSESGLLVDDVVLEVEAGKVREFARATGALDDAHTDESAAAERGQRARIATLTHTVALGHLRDQAALVDRLGLDIRRVVVGEVSWRYFRPIVVGDRLRVTRRVVSDERKDGTAGSLRLVTLESECADAEQKVVTTVREVLIERGVA